MAIQTATVSNRLDTDTATRAWAQAVLDALTTGAGLVQTADTGQLNPATVTAPAAGATLGYYILRFNDALQSTAPIYIKVILVATSTTAFGYCQFSFASGTDGAGTLTGASIFTFNGAGGSTTGDVTAYGWGASGHGSSFSFVTMSGYAGTSSRAGQQILVVSRTQDSDGTYNGDGFFVLGNSGYQTNVQWGLRTTTGSTASNTSSANGLAAFTGNNQGGSAVSGADISFFPLLVILAGKIQGAPTVAVGAFLGDIAVGSTFTLSTRTYLALGARSAKMDVTGSTSSQLCVRWE